jgi:hypothetical protein
MPPRAATLLLVALPLTTVAGCYGCYPSRTIHFPVGHVPETVTNFRELNTPYDDFNAAAPPMLLGNDWLGLSTNRSAPAAGNRIALFRTNYWFRQTDGSFTTGAVERGTLPLAHEGPEFGPLFVRLDQPPARVTRLPPGSPPARDGGEVSLLFTGRNAAGDLDLHVSEPFDPETAAAGPTIKVAPAARLNLAGSDQAYASFGPDGRLYLASNHGGHFDIYAVKAGPPAGAHGDAWLTWLADPTAPAAELEPVAALDSPGDDTAPSMLDGTMVFASNRAGSAGGYDLYWSTFAAGSGWSAPVPIAVANGPTNEFRPTLIAVGSEALSATAEPTFDNQLLLFSSDRPGGLGGYDMYYVGVAAPGIAAAARPPAN